MPSFVIQDLVPPVDPAALFSMPSFVMQHLVPFLVLQLYCLGRVDYVIYRGSNLSAHVLLNLLNEFWKRNQMRGLPSILSLLRHEFNKSNNTGARMLDSIYNMTLRFL